MLDGELELLEPAAMPCTDPAQEPRRLVRGSSVCVEGEPVQISKRNEQGLERAYAFLQVFDEPSCVPTQQRCLSRSGPPLDEQSCMIAQSLGERDGSRLLTRADERVPFGR